jgi:hypothetical protein
VRSTTPQPSLNANVDNTKRHTNAIYYINCCFYKYGAFGVFYYFIILLFNNKEYPMDLVTGVSLPMWMDIGLGISALVFGFFVGAWRQVATNRKKNKANKNINWQVHSQIHELLTELRFSTDAARTQLVQFHNGEYFMDGVSMRKLSLTHESVSKGVSEGGERLHGFLLSLFTPLVGKVLDDVAVLHHTKQEKDSFFKNFFLAENIDSYMVLPIKHSGMSSGYVIVQWCSPAKTKSVQKKVEDIAEFMLETRNQIQIQLDDQMRTVHD